MEKKLEKFKDGDLVVVFGGDITTSQSTADTVAFCKVVVVGQSDLVVETTSYYATTYHVVPKTICRKIHMEPKKLTSARIISPRIGDLVVNFSRGDDGTVKKKTGILTKIIYRLGQPDRCEIMCGTETSNVNYSNLVVLRDAQKELIQN